MPNQSELDLIFDTSYPDVQPYLFKVRQYWWIIKEHHYMLTLQVMCQTQSDICKTSFPVHCQPYIMNVFWRYSYQLLEDKIITDWENCETVIY
jgi:hypothetical protein